MRIGIFTEPVHYHIWSGTGRVVHELVTHLARIDTQNEYVLFNTCGVTDASAFGITQPNFRTVAIPGGRKLRWAAWSALNFPPVEKWTGPLDVMHTPFHLVPPSRAPFVVTLLDTIILHEPAMFTPQLRYFNRQTFSRARNAAAVACISETTRLDAASHTQIPPDKLHVIYIGVSEKFTPAPASPSEAAGLRQKYGITGEYFLNLGVIQPRKNQHRLIEAFEQFRAAAPGDKTQLVLAGQKGWITGEFDDRLARSPARPGIIVTGRVDDADVPALMRHARAFVFPTLLEGFGLPALEAMASNTPLIASDIPVLREIADGCALFIDPLDTASLAAALTEISNNPNAAAKRATTALQRAQHPQFTWHNMAEQYLELYIHVAR